MGWTHIGMRKVKPVMIFQRPPKIKLAVRSTWPVSESESMMGRSVPRSPREPLNSPKRKPDLKDWSLESVFGIGLEGVNKALGKGRGVILLRMGGRQDLLGHASFFLLLPWA